MMIKFRDAQDVDVDNIAQFHARSWQIHYRGIVRDAYLDQEVYEERKAVWKARFAHPNPDQHLIMAEKNGLLCGFACVFSNYHQEWGAYLDNLHVSPEYQGQGIGYKLLRKAAEKSYTHQPQDPGYYLWVFRDNLNAIEFYERAGGERREMQAIACPDGNSYACLRYHWSFAKLLM